MPGMDTPPSLARLLYTQAEAAALLGIDEKTLLADVPGAPG